MTVHLLKINRVGIKINMKTINNYIYNEKISSLDEYITEKLKIGKSTKQQYTCQPKDKRELRKILEERLGKNKDADLNDIDVSEITDMANIFYGLDPHNIDVSQWDVSSVIDMDYMFSGSTNFNCDLSQWNVSKVETMQGMFYSCDNFNCDLSQWNVSKVINMRHMFGECQKFNSDLSDWNVSNVRDMSWMLYKCTSMKNKPSWYKE